jgi:hypothetical protein
MPTNPTKCVCQAQEPTGNRSNLLNLATLLLCVVSLLSLASCAGYTSAGTGQAGGTTGGGVLTPSPTSVSFGSVAVGSTSVQSVSVTNTGTGTVDISGASVTGGVFTVVGGTPSNSLAAGQSATVQVQFAPTSMTPASGALTVTSNASNSSLGISLSGTGLEAVPSFSPTSLNFNNVTVGQTSTQNVTLSNTGNTNLVVTSAIVSGAGFGLTNFSAPKTIAANGSTTFGVTFTPSSTNGASGSILFTDNAPGATQTFTMTGSAVAAGNTLNANPGSFNFNSVVVGQTSTQPIVLTNSGATTITISSVTASAGFGATGVIAGQQIAAGGSATVTASFAPTAAGTVSGSITVSSNATNSPLVISVSGTGTQAALSANPSSINFGNIAVGNTSTVNVTLKNTGTASLNITSASASGTGFSMSTLSPQTLAPQATVAFTVTFGPTATGTVSGSVSVGSTAPGSPLVIGLSGTGAVAQAQIAANPTTVSFGTVAVSSTNSQPIILTNGGTATLTFSQITVTGTGFGQTGLSTSTTIAAGAQMTFNATFAPTSTGAVTGTISLSTNAPSSPLVINLSGTGQAQTFLLGANPTTLPFGTVLNGTSSQLTSTMTNNGNSNITISGVTTLGTGFTASGISNGTVLTPGQTATLTVTFAPTQGGAVSGATVSIASNATGSPTVVTLTGTGQHNVVLNWTASPTGGVTYNIFRGTTAGGEGTTPVNAAPVTTTTYTDSNVTAGVNYFYTVEAVNSAGSSAPSNEASATVPTP